MGRKKSLTLQQRQDIINRRQLGEGVKAIARSVGVCPKTVRNTCKLLQETGGLEDGRHRSGRYRLTSTRTDRVIHRMSEADRWLTATDIQRRMLTDYRLQLSLATVKRRLCCFGLHGRVARRKPLISQQNRRRRLQWAKEHRQWTAEDWSRVIWTDESRFSRLDSSVRAYVRRRVGEELNQRCVAGTVRGGGGSVMVWGAMSALGTGPLVEVVGTLDSSCYLTLLEQHALPMVSMLPGQFVWQQDNAPPHSAHITRQWLHDHGWTVMQWPAQSPDLSPIENVWAQIGRAVRRMPTPSTLADLRDSLFAAWQQVTPLQCRRLSESMPRRVQAVLRARGGPTGY